MNITLQYTGQLVTAAGRHSESVEAAEGERLVDIFERLASDGRDPSFRALVLTPLGEIQRTLLVVVDDGQWIGDRNAFTVEKGMEITLMLPMSGG